MTAAPALYVAPAAAAAAAHKILETIRSTRVSTDRPWPRARRDPGRDSEGHGVAFGSGWPETDRRAPTDGRNAPYFSPSRGAGRWAADTAGVRTMAVQWLGGVTPTDSEKRDAVRHPTTARPTSTALYDVIREVKAVGPQRPDRSRTKIQTENRGVMSPGNAVVQV